MYSRRRSSPRSSIFCGVSAISNNARVALLTPASVACADSTTATSSVNGLTCSSSPFGSGLALRKRLKTSWTSAGVQGFVALSDFFAGAFGFATTAFAFFFGTGALRGAGLRVIFAMIGIY
ncbi:hypothetical protein ACVWW2_000789 [Bradyrhizobium sp. LM4.3]